MRSTLAFTLLLAIFLVPLGLTRAEADETGARQFIRDLGDQAISLLQDSSAGTANRRDGVRDILRTSFDMPTIGRFVLGRHWRNATEDQQSEYLSLFEEMVIETYSRRFTEYNNETFVVDGSRLEGERDILVHSRIIREDGPAVEVMWRVRDRGAGMFQIVDVMVEGVSMAVTQRNEFSSIIQRNGGNIDALLQAIREQIASLRSEA